MTLSHATASMRRLFFFFFSFLLFSLKFYFGGKLQEQRVDMKGWRYTMQKTQKNER